MKRQIATILVTTIALFVGLGVGWEARGDGQPAAGSESGRIATLVHRFETCASTGSTLTLEHHAAGLGYSSVCPK